MATAQRPWRILIVDDSVDDAELAEIALRQDGIDAIYQRVERETPLRDALATFVPDLVLCDMNLPGFSGLEAFDVVRAVLPGARFVFISGSAPYDVKVPVADGALLKDDFARLPALVRRVLAEPARSTE